MKPTKVQVKVNINTNWANEKYAIFSTKDYKEIAELDFPIEGRGTRVYPVALNRENKDVTNYICLSSLPQGIIAAETAVKAYLLDKGYYVTKFEYPQELAELRKDAFKINKK